MQVSISARHGHLSPTTQEKITEKIQKIKRFFDRVSAIEVTVDLEHRDTVGVEVRVSAEHTADFVASESAKELFVALDSVVHKLEQQLRKHKEKIQTGRRQAGRNQTEMPLDEPG